jgi:peptide subunit release factor 1 (eRF1)
MTLEIAAPLSDVLDRLAGFEPSDAPVISLYLDARADAHGKDRFPPGLPQELDERARTFRPHTPARESFDEDVKKIRAYLEREVVPRANGAAIFACTAAGLFEAVQIEAPFDRTRLFVAREPQLYPLARALDQYRRYVAVVTDTNRARIFVFGLSRLVRATEVTSRKTRRSSVGGWSQMRYQRHVDNFRAGHAREVVEALERVMREEGLDEVVLAGDEVVMPLVRSELPKPLAAQVVDVLRLDMRTPEHEVLAATVEALRRHDAETDAEKVRRALDEARSGGLGVVGARETSGALQAGQVDELLIAADPRAVRPEEGGAEEAEALAGGLVSGARQTGARITFIEDVRLAEEMAGVAALLRYRIAPGMAAPQPAPREGADA